MNISSAALTTEDTKAGLLELAKASLSRMFDKNTCQAYTSLISTGLKSALDTPLSLAYTGETLTITFETNSPVLLNPADWQNTTNTEIFLLMDDISYHYHYRYTFKVTPKKASAKPQ